MTRWKWFVVIVALAVVVLIATVYAYLNTYDYNKLKPRITRMVKEATGRDVSLSGQIDLAIGFSPALVARDISFANAPWASQPQMLKIDELQAQVRLLPLLVRNVALRRIRLQGVDVVLETNPDGEGNWEFAADQSPAKKPGASKVTKLNIDNIRIENLNLSFHNGKTGSVKRINLIDLKVIRQTDADELAVDLRANYLGQPLTLSGKTGPLSTAMAAKRFPFELSGALSDTIIKLEGTLDDVLALKGIDVKVQTAGENLAKLKLADNIQLPQTNAFDITGHLRGSKESLALNDAGGTLSANGISLAFSGNVGDLIALSGIDLKLSGTGKNLSEIGPIIGEKLPVTDNFQVHGRLTGSARTLSFSEAQGRVHRGDLSLTMKGGVKDLPNFKGVDLEVNVSGIDLSEAGRIIDQKLPASDAFAFESRLTGSAKSLSLTKARGSATRGSIKVALSGEVRDLNAFSGLNLHLKGSGKNLAEIGSIIGVKLPATDKFAVEGRLKGSVKSLSLQQSQGSAKRGSLNLTLSGGIEQLQTLNGINIKIKAFGRELAEIGPLVGGDLPELGPFSVRGKLSGSAKAISLNGFSAVVDRSDFNGLARLEFLKRPKITLRLESSVIDFTRLMQSLEKGEQKPATKDRQQHRLFPDDPLPFDVLRKIDADIVLKARNVRVKDARLEFGSMALKLEEHDLSIDNLEATYKKTRISGDLKINADRPSRVATHFLVQNFNLGDFLKETGKSDQVHAIVDIAAHGKSKGNSVSSLMANLDGSIGAVMGEGFLTRYLDLLSVGLSQKVAEIWKPSKAVEQIKCAVVQFDVKEGVAASRAFVFNTRAGILSGEGKINLETEQINFLLVPEPKHFGLSFSTKLRVSGTVLDPRVRPDTVSLLSKGARALSALVVGPLGLLAPFVNLGAHKPHPCNIHGIGNSATPNRKN